jgi:4-hydroxy-tetrahydrodipicolinate synthase
MPSAFSLAEGLIAFFAALVEATADRAIPLYLYNFPALSGIAYTLALVTKLVERFGSRIAGLKDSSGDIDYANAIAEISNTLDVFPSNEQHLLSSRPTGPFAGCISATVNLNAPDCRRAMHARDKDALDRAVRVRKLFDGLPLVPAVKTVVAHLTGDARHGRAALPMMSLSASEAETLVTRYRAVTVGTLSPVT